MAFLNGYLRVVYGSTELLIQDHLLVIISMRLKSGQDGRSSSSVHPVVELTWIVCPVI